MPSAPSSLSPSSTRSGIFASRSISSGSTSRLEERAAAAPGTPRPARPRRRRAAAGARSGRAGSCRGTAPCRSWEASTRVSRAASATSRACRSVTSVDMAVEGTPRRTMTLSRSRRRTAPAAARSARPSPSGSASRSSTARSRPAWPSGSRVPLREAVERDESVGSWLTRALLSFGQVGPVLAGATPLPGAVLTDDAFRAGDRAGAARARRGEGAVILGRAGGDRARATMPGALHVRLTGPREARIAQGDAARGRRPRDGRAPPRGVRPRARGLRAPLLPLRRARRARTTTS